MKIENNIYEILASLSQSELIAILQNSEEYNEETVECAKHILSVRNVEVESFYQTKKAPSSRIAEDEEIKSTRAKAKLLLITGLILSIGSMVLLVIGAFYESLSIRYLIFATLGLAKLYFSAKYFKRSKRLSRNRDLVNDSNLSSNELHLLTELNNAVMDIQGNGTGKLKDFVSKHITQENFGQIRQNYEQVFHEDFIEEIKNLNSKYSAIREMLLPFIELGILESEYPHRELKHQLG